VRTLNKKLPPQITFAAEKKYTFPRKFPRTGYVFIFTPNNFTNAFNSFAETELLLKIDNDY
jgi:hypothetical protein